MLAGPNRNALLALFYIQLVINVYLTCYFSHKFDVRDEMFEVMRGNLGSNFFQRSVLSGLRFVRAMKVMLNARSINKLGAVNFILL